MSTVHCLNFFTQPDEPFGGSGLGGDGGGDGGGDTGDAGGADGG
jgi:hypothetical protein